MVSFGSYREKGGTEFGGYSVVIDVQLILVKTKLAAKNISMSITVVAGLLSSLK